MIDMFVFLSDSQPQPQRGVSDEFPGRIQVYGRPNRVPKTSEVPGGHHLHRKHGCH